MNSETNPDAPFDLDRFLPYRMNVLAHRLSTELAAIYETRFDISIPEWRVLAHLSMSSKVSVREIHARVNMDKAKVTRAAQQLEASGLVTKDINAEDRRLVSLKLTAKGKALFARIQPLALEYERQMLSRLSKDEQSQLDAIITKLLEP